MTASAWGGRHVHDPTVVRDDDGAYWMFSTDARSDGPVRAGVQVRTSRDMVTWTFHGWALDGVPGPAAEWSRASGLWAPDVVRAGEPGAAEWRMYYSASTFGSRRSAIGLAIAPHPSGPWADRGIVIASDHVHGPDGLGHPNAIDANLVTAEGGRQWLVYGSFFGGIYALPVDASTGFVVDAPAAGALRRSPGKLLARRSRLADGAVEGAFVLPRPDGGWALLVSYDSLAGTYHVRSGVGDDVTGTFRDRAGRLMTDGAPGTQDAASGVDPWQVGVPVLASHRLAGGPGILAPGHASVLTEPDRQLLVHHVRDADAPTEHRVQVRRLVWTHDGWPLVSPQLWAGPSRENDDVATWPADAGALGGAWEVLDVGAAPAKVADGTIGGLGDVLDGVLAGIGRARALGEGRFAWESDADAARVWAAVVFPGWDAVRDRATLCLAAMDDAGRVVTGTKVSDE
ncbi:arabinan endo-1,5-alpha-L-arabinosidase [Promicromonospora panici]|uniref:arabinan endo-1,5-alpha-L-arabinosidase n=1 Tax=Promicromonospora panici TaxID=2219658 RepID=UPI00101BAEC1|nr:arabinan endo-1,5-alpha-L-arabinosidase [Promicromonospora panici]